MIDDKICVVLKNSDGYKLYLNKDKCTKPDDLYQITLTEETRSTSGDVSINEKSYFMSEDEIGYFVRALMC